LEPWKPPLHRHQYHDHRQVSMAQFLLYWYRTLLCTYLSSVVLRRKRALLRNHTSKDRRRKNGVFPRDHICQHFGVNLLFTTRWNSSWTGGTNTTTTTTVQLGLLSRFGRLAQQRPDPKRTHVQNGVSVADFLQVSVYSMKRIDFHLNPRVETQQLTFVEAADLRASTCYCWVVYWLNRPRWATGGVEMPHLRDNCCRLHRFPVLSRELVGDFSVYKKHSLPTNNEKNAWNIIGKNLSCFSAYSSIFIRRTKSFLRFSWPFRSPCKNAIRAYCNKCLF